MLSVPRPHVGEDEEEILRQEKEFFQNMAKTGTKPAACSKRKSSENDNAKYSGPTQNASVKKRKSKFAREREGSEARVSQPAVSSTVLGDVVEKMYGGDVVVLPPTTHTCEGFPRAVLRDRLEYVKGKSIFLQQLDTLNITPTIPQRFQIRNTNSDLQQTSDEATDTFGTRSYMVSGAESLRIHQENVQRLQEMSVVEIAAERDKLMTELDPELVRFLRSRRVPTDKEEEPPREGDAQRGNLGNTSKKVSFLGMGEASDSRMETDSESPSASSLLVKSPLSSFAEDGAGDSPSVPLPFSASEMENFVHMNIVEEEKLEWTTDLPTLKPPPDDAPYSARFDFKGMLLPFDDASISVDRALHHHGDEPERPGYTLQELFVLGRSSVLQQRVVALVTIANIVSKAKLGIYDKCFTPPLLHQLVDKNIFLLLRFSLDDANIAVVTAAVNALRNLLVNKTDEVFLDSMLGYADGVLQPSLYIEPSTKEVNEQQEMKDHQVVEEDMVRGALRTDLLSRLCYILGTLKPDGRAVVAILETLTRIARHSYDAAREIMRFPLLMTTIVNSFLTKNWEKLVTASCSSTSPPSSLYGLPVVQAVKLLRIIAARSRQLASDLVHKFHMMERVAVYITLTQQTELRTRDKELLLLNRESLYLWQTFLSYNLATEHFRQMQPVLMGLIHYHWEQTNIQIFTSTFNYEHGAALIAVIEQVLLAADAQGRMITRLSSAKSPTSIPSTVVVDDCTPYVPVLEHCLKKWVAQLGSGDDYSCTFSTLKLISATMCCLATFYRIHAKVPTSDVVNLLEGLQETEECLYKNLFANDFFSDRITIHLLSSSNLIRLSSPTGRRDPPSLPSVGSLCWGGDLAPVVHSNSPMLFLRGLTDFLVAVHAVHRGLDKRCLKKLLATEVVASYVKYIVSRQELELRDNWFTRNETRFLVNLVKLSHVVEPRASNRNGLFYDLAVRLVTLVQSGDRHLLRDIMRDIVFNPNLVVDSSPLVTELEGLSIVEGGRRNSKDPLLAFTAESLPQVWQCYESALGLSVPPATPLDCISLTVEDVDGALPADWVYLPLLVLSAAGLGGAPGSAGVVDTATRCLSWALVVERLQDVLLAGVTVTSRFCRVATVFLAASDLFLDPNIVKLLEDILTQLTREGNLMKLDFSSSIPGLSSFYDLYAELLEQFAAVSYGSQVFAKYLLLPLRQKEDISFRRQVWFEHAACVRVLSVGVDALPFPLVQLLWPHERDPRLLAAYLRALIHGTVRKAWSPVLYTVALHHVAFFLNATCDDEPLVALQTMMKQSMEKPNATELKAVIQEYNLEFWNSMAVTMSKK